MKTLQSLAPQLLSKLFGLFFTIEWEVQKQDYQTCWRTYSNGFDSMHDSALHLVGCIVNDPTGLFRIEKRFVLSRNYPSDRFYQKVEVSFVDAASEFHSIQKRWETGISISVTVSEGDRTLNHAVSDLINLRRWQKAGHLLVLKNVNSDKNNALRQQLRDMNAFESKIMSWLNCLPPAVRTPSTSQINPS